MHLLAYISARIFTSPLDSSLPFQVQSGYFFRKPKGFLIIIGRLIAGLSKLLARQVSSIAQKGIKTND